MESSLMLVPDSPPRVLRENCSLYIGGEWVLAAKAPGVEVIDPALGEVIGAVPAATPHEVDRAVRSAGAASKSWAGTPVPERAQWLRLLADAIERRAAEFAYTISRESGSPITLCREYQVPFPITFLREQADWIEKLALEERIGHSLVVREPVGVVAAIAPWNFPLLLAMNKVAAALAAGCPVILKPSELAPLHALLLADVANEVGLPPGVLNVITGGGSSVGEGLAAHPDVAMISLTGSTAAGRRVAELAAGAIKRVSLELGGKSASIVLEDADLQSAISTTVSQCFWNSGQNCMAWSRLLLPRALYEDGVRLAADCAARRQVGDPLQEGTEIGPLISSTRQAAVLAMIGDALSAGATAATNGAQPPRDLERGYFVTPTVLRDVRPEMAVAQQEIFGPVLCALPYETEDEAVEIANETRFGLHGAVFSGDVERAASFARRLNTGMVDINGAALNPDAPFGGRNQSGVGRELGRFGIEGYLEYKAIQLPDQ